MECLKGLALASELLLVYVNDKPEEANSYTSLFADDATLL